MKFFTLILIMSVFISISCNRNGAKEVSNKKTNTSSICLLNVKYFHEEGVFQSPDNIFVVISFKDSILLDNVSDVIFKNIPQQDRELFVKSHHFKNTIDSTTLIVQTNYFNFDTLHKKSVTEIESLLNNNISLVIKKDTIPLLYCK